MKGTRTKHARHGLRKAARRKAHALRQDRPASVVPVEGALPLALLLGRSA